MSKRVKTSTAGFIVIWDDRGGMTTPYGNDDDCEGGITAFNDTVRVFASRKDAQRSIRISAANAKLQREQGRPVTDDFLGDARKNIRIVPLVG
jgi:hypothetical protein